MLFGPIFRKKLNNHYFCDIFFTWYKNWCFALRITSFLLFLSLKKQGGVNRWYLCVNFWKTFTTWVVKSGKICKFLLFFVTFLIFGIIFLRKSNNFYNLKENFCWKVVCCKQKILEIFCQYKTDVILRAKHQFLHQVKNMSQK